MRAHRFSSTPSSCGRLWLIAAVMLLALGASRTARAYPQWQLSSGATRCNQCHYDPGGGGLITSYGRDADGEELSMLPGNGALLYGTVSPPSWLALGGDLRGGSVANDVQDPRGPTYAVFPMQADAYARVAFGGGLSAYGVLGFRGQVRDSSGPVPLQNYQPIDSSRLISREHYLMLQPEVLGPYVRAGRFFAPFGLRLAEHVTYIRRDLGFDTLQETYNLSAGYVYPTWELHVTGFLPDFVRHIGSVEKGVAAYYERRLLGDALALGAQTRVAAGPGMTRLIVGGVGKLYVEPVKTLFLAEVNGVHMVFDSNAVGSRDQVVAAAGFAVLPLRGLVATLLAERNQQDIAVSGAAWTAGTALLSWFPFPHVELQAMARVQVPSGTDATKTLFAQLHYFL